jgi:hypothetical protein
MKTPSRAERKSGYQQRDVPRIKSSVDALVRNYDEKVDKALVLNSLVKYAAQPAASNAGFDVVRHQGRHEQGRPASRRWTSCTPAASWATPPSARPGWSASRKTSRPATTLHHQGCRGAVRAGPEEADDEELGGKLQQAYANYMKAKIAYMNSKGQAVYDANSTLRVTFGKIAARGADGTVEGLHHRGRRGCQSHRRRRVQRRRKPKRSRPRTSASMSIRC